MNNLTFESFYAAVLKNYVFDNLSYDIFADVSSFLSISGKYIMWHHSTPLNPIEPRLMCWVYLYLLLRGLATRKLEKKMFFSKN